jgi:hypothetical protein
MLAILFGYLRPFGTRAVGFVIAAILGHSLLIAFVPGM